MSWSREDAEKAPLNDAVISKLKQARANQETKPENKPSHAAVTSKDWVPDYQNSNYSLSIDVEFDKIFDEADLNAVAYVSTGSSSSQAHTVAEAVPDKYMIEYFNTFPNHPPALTNDTPVVTPSQASAAERDPAEDLKAQEDCEPPSLVDSPESSIKRRKTAPPPEVREYIEGEPEKIDVLCGRGGRSNHHPGNKRYRNEVANLQIWYKSSAKTEKTDLAQNIVDYVHGYGGRFVQKDTDVSKWFIVTNLKARKKASQALRELKTAEERKQMKRKQANMESA